MSISPFKNIQDDTFIKSQKNTMSHNILNNKRIFQSEKPESNTIANINEQNKEQSTVGDDFQKDNEVMLTKEKEKIIKYPFNWVTTQPKKMNNVDLFVNKQALSNGNKGPHIKGSIEEKSKEHLSSFHISNTNKKLLEGKKTENMKHCQGNINNEKQSIMIPQDNNLSSDQSISINGNEDGKGSKFKECYLDLLIIAADNLTKKGIGITDHKKRNNCKKTPSKEGNNTNQIFQKKCQNKICPVIVTNANNYFQTTMGTQKNKVYWLCTQCYQACKNGQYCYYCGIIYRGYNGKKGFNDSSGWIGCEFCKNWEHIKCEEFKGNYPNLSTLIKDSKFKYKCPLCHKNSSQENDKAFKSSSNDTHSNTDCLLKKKTMIFNDDYNSLSNSALKQQHLG